MSHAEEDVSALIQQLASREPDQQLMMVNTNWLSETDRGWTVHFINQVGSCALGEVEGKYVGRGVTLAAALLDCLGNYDSRWTEEMEHEYNMAQPIEGCDE